MLSMLFALASAIALIVWALIFLAVRPLTPERRAGLLFAVMVSQPIALLLLSERTAANVGANTSISAPVSQLGMALNLLAVVLALSLALSPGHPLRGGGMGIMVIGVWTMASALAIASLLGAIPSSPQYFLAFALELTAIMLAIDRPGVLIRWAVWTLRVVVYVSLASALIAPDWAFIGAGTFTGAYDRTLFGLPRLLGLAPHPNALAIASVLLLVLELGGNRGTKLTRWLGAGGAGISVLLAQSNTGYVATAVGIMVLFAARNSKYRTILLVSAATVAALYAFSPSLLMPSSLKSGQYISSVSGRDAIWRIALAEWERHPWFGFGPAVFGEQYRLTRLPADMQQASHAHNQLMQTLADSGLVGAVGLLLVLIGASLCAIHARRVDGGVSLALLASFVLFGITETPLRVVGLAAVPALIVLSISAVTARRAYGVPGATAPHSVAEPVGNHAPRRPALRPSRSV